MNSDGVRRFATLAMICGLTAPISATEIGSNYVYGYVTAITSLNTGILIRIDSGVAPTNCVSPPYGWMYIDQAKTAMSSVLLSHWLADKRLFVVYTDPTVSGNYCSVVQVQPS